MKVWFCGSHGNPVRTIVTRIESANVDMFWWGMDKRHMILGYTELVMGWMVCREQCIKETVECAFAYVSDVADLHGTI